MVNKCCHNLVENIMSNTYYILSSSYMTTHAMNFLNNFIKKIAVMIVMYICLFRGGPGNMTGLTTP